MNSRLQPYLGYTRAQRLGLVALFCLIAVLQVLNCLIDFAPPETDSPSRRQWLALQLQVDSLRNEARTRKPKIYPFNPNFITDSKGYRLGMSVAEIDRLLAFRKQHKYVNSAREFQQVTKVPDALLLEIAPYFKFPDWAANRTGSDKRDFGARKKEKIVVTDINEATQDDLVKIYGIGPALSRRILKQRELLGGFVDMRQMNDVWGLPAEVTEELRQRFAVLSVPNVKKITVNDASLKELAAFPYFRYQVAKSILTYRSMNGRIRNADDLTKIPDFPVDNLKTISLYLEF